MPALAPYIPNRDADLQTFAQNFSTLITASPASYGLVAGDATAIASAYTSWNTAYLAAVNPSTRTPVTVAAKDVAKTSLLATIRPYAQTISLNAGVSSGNKIALGVNPRTSTPTPIATPTTNPVLDVTQALPLQHVLRYRDSTASPSVKSKPYGVIQCQIFAQASATPITDPAAIAFKQAVTKAPALLTFDSADVGKKIYYAARWVTRSGKVGPFSPITSFTLAA